MIMQSRITRDVVWVLRLIYIFTGVALFTIEMILYIERRKEIAALKAIGESFKQTMKLTILERTPTWMGGLGLGLLFSFGLIATVPLFAEISNERLITLLIVAVIGILCIIALSQIMPLMTLRTASVNQLLYSRVIPIWVKRINAAPDTGEVRKWISQEGIKLLRLPTDQGQVDCLLLRSSGMVKQGEVIATLESLGGLYVEEWVSPVDGEIVEITGGGYVVIRSLEGKSP
jgi:hypothetical protein